MSGSWLEHAQGSRDGWLGSDLSPPCRLAQMPQMVAVAGLPAAAQEVKPQCIKFFSSFADVPMAIGNQMAKPRFKE